ncbi:hypothetical protein P9112_009099 [Eukaryota sp. TZLM1-RC]
MHQTSLDNFYAHRRRSSGPLQPVKKSRTVGTKLKPLSPKVQHKSTPEPPSISKPQSPSVESPPVTFTELGPSKPIVNSSFSTPNTSLSTALPSRSVAPNTHYLKDLIQSSSSSTKPLSVEYHTLISVFDAISSVFISHSRSPCKSLCWTTLRSSVQRLLTIQKVDFTLVHLRQLVALCPSLMQLSLNDHNQLLIKSNGTTADWHSSKSFIQSYLLKRMECAHIKFLEKEKGMPSDQARLVTSKSSVWDARFNADYLEPLPLADMPEVKESKVKKNQEEKVLQGLNQHRAQERKIQESARNGQSVIDCSKINNKVNQIPADLIALSIHRKSLAENQKKIDYEIHQKTSQERYLKVCQLLKNIISAENLRSIPFSDAVKRIKSDSSLEYQSEQVIFEDLKQFVENSENLIERRNRIIITGDFL